MKYVFFGQDDPWNSDWSNNILACYSDCSSMKISIEINSSTRDKSLCAYILIILSMLAFFQSLMWSEWKQDERTLYWITSVFSGDSCYSKAVRDELTMILYVNLKIIFMRNLHNYTQHHYVNIFLFLQIYMQMILTKTQKISANWNKCAMHIDHSK